MNIPKNKFLLFVAFLATIAIAYHGSTKLTTSRLDYGRHTTDLSGKERIAVISDKSSLFPKKEQIMETPEVASATKNQISAGELVSVLRVIDGDTIVAKVNGQPIHIRLIGINTPELNDKRPQVACFALKAKEEAERLLAGQNVNLEKDPTQGDYDKYNRLLAYIFTVGKTNFNKLMIKEGYAYEYTYHPGRAGLPYKYQKEFKAAQTEARTAQRGLWNSNVCGN